MARYIVSRVGQMIITMFIVSLLVFFMIRLKGDPITIMAPPHFNEEQVESLRRAWGFDKPLSEQYLIFITKAITGDFGKSMSHNTPAMDLVVSRLRLTYLLAGVSAIIGILIAVPLGVLSALNRNSWLDVSVSALASLGTAMPNFWLGLMLIIVFSVQLGWFPVFGSDSLRAIVLPATCLGTGMAARLSRLTRSSMLEALRQDYMRTARSKGLKPRRVNVVHALRNALIPVITALGLQLGWLLGGSVVVESVFAWPGLGRLVIESIHVRDITVVQAAVFWFSFSFIMINLIVDLLYSVVDPRVKIE
ncbi:MAG TPA: ABC transporter permease [Chloroflexi bacterium]|nr:ABC transporter permease [Chloroflexota bacterium]